MAEETTAKDDEPKPQGPKKRLTKPQAITVMVLGGLMILIPWFFFPAEEGSMGQIVKVLVGGIGFCVLCVGAYYRP